MPDQLSTSDVLPSDEVAALGSLYEAERTDGAASQSTVLALLAAGVAYISASSTFSEDIFARLGWAAVFVPIPVWIIAAFQSLIVVTAMIRSLSVRALEYKLFRHTSFTPEESEGMGLRALERVMNLGDEKGKWPHKLANVFSYAATLILAIGYTIYLVSQAPGLPVCARVAVFAFYALVLGLVLASWRSGGKLYEELAGPLARYL
ncbi:hypothetical protein [Micromonospora sp. NPDC005324]|uniref:hypothetical protein n=1 Tax=Micromonospora sp. NPDC005324 TaxID=3157033 RepID=UPI0033A6D5EC